MIAVTLALICVVVALRAYRRHLTRGYDAMFTICSRDAALPCCERSSNAGTEPPTVPASSHATERTTLP